MVSGEKYYADPNTGELYRNGFYTIDGKNYYFDEEGRCEQLSQAKGIDVSAAQGHIDWKQVADSGVEFAIIRAVHWANGGYSIDPYFLSLIHIYSTFPLPQFGRYHFYDGHRYGWSSGTVCRQ